MNIQTPTPDGHADRIIVRKSADGWEVTDARENSPARTQHYSDWHRVERAVRVLEIAITPAHSAASTKR